MGLVQIKQKLPEIFELPEYVVINKALFFLLLHFFSLSVKLFYETVLLDISLTYMWIPHMSVSLIVREKYHKSVL